MEFGAVGQGALKMGAVWRGDDGTGCWEKGALDLVLFDGGYGTSCYGTWSYSIFEEQNIDSR